MVAIFAFCGQGFGQRFASGNLPNPDILQIGYAIVSPLAGSGTGLLAFEEITKQTAGTAFIGTILPSPLVTNTMLTVTSQGFAGEDTGIAIVNPNDLSANVTLTLRNHEGIIVQTRTIILQPRQHVADFLAGFFGSEPLGITGLLSISSSSPIGVIAVIFRGDDFADSPSTAQLGLTSVSFPSPLILFPHWASGAGWATRVVISNTAFILQTVQVDFYSSAGTLLVSVRNVNIPGGGVAVVSPAALQ
jgi:hypothetical protein